MYETTTDDCNADARLRSTMQLVVVVLCMFPLSMIKSMDSLKVRGPSIHATAALTPSSGLLRAVCEQHQHVLHVRLRRARRLPRRLGAQRPLHPRG